MADILATSSATTLGYQYMPRPDVLVVEDEPDLAGLIKHTLERSGDADVRVVASGDLALKAVAAKLADLIILDLNLPVLGGLEVCRILRSRAETRQIPIIMLTALDSEADIVLGLEAGADDYVTKPFGLAELRSRIRAVMRRAGARTDGADTVRVGPSRSTAGRGSSPSRAAR